MQQLAVLVLAAVWCSARCEWQGTVDGFGIDSSVNVQGAQIYGQNVDEPLDYYRQAIALDQQQPAYELGQRQGYNQGPVQSTNSQQAQGEKFLSRAPHQQPTQDVASPPMRMARAPYEQPVQGVAPSPRRVTSREQGSPEVVVPIKPPDGSGDKPEGSASHLQHQAKFSLCDVMPPPWNILCMIIEFIFFTWPMYYFWLGLIALAIIYRIYLAFKEVLDPIIIAILDFIYLIVWTIVTVCKAIWRCIKVTTYPMKESILRCKDAIDFHLNPWKQRRPHTHVPGFSY